MEHIHGQFHSSLPYMEGVPLVVLIFGIFILDVKIVKIDWAEAGRNSSSRPARRASPRTSTGLYLLYSVSAGS